MKTCLLVGAVVLCGAASDEQCEEQGLLQSRYQVQQLRTRSRLHKFVPTRGFGGSLSATLDGTCTEDKYTPSLLETEFTTNVLAWTKDQATLCEHLGDRHTWIQENVKGTRSSESRIFSTLCKKGEPPQLLEPLAGILRDPTYLCDGDTDEKIYSIDWLVLADSGRAKAPSGKNIFFDAGGTRFKDAMNFFTSHYEKRGITFDKIYVWEAKYQGYENYWQGVPHATRKKWEQRLTFYDGVPCSADLTDDNNPPKRILAECREQDFCAFKLDIDTPGVELPIVDQLATTPEIAKVLDEFFFEHHVGGLMQLAWGDAVNGTFLDSYHIFQKLRRSGVRAHSWI